MRNLLLFLLIASIQGCDNSDDKMQQFNLDTGVEFSIRNTENEDLLNPGNPNSFDVNTIKVFYVIDGKTTEVYDKDLDYPRNFRIYEHQDEYRIAIFPNHAETEQKPITYVQWNESDRDTIEVAYDRSQDALLQNRIWLNGEQVWERGDNTVDPYFVLEK